MRVVTGTVGAGGARIGRFGALAVVIDAVGEEHLVAFDGWLADAAPRLSAGMAIRVEGDDAGVALRDYGGDGVGAAVALRASRIRIAGGMTLVR
jgi:hypothetical protein